MDSAKETGIMEMEAKRMDAEHRPEQPLFDLLLARVVAERRNLFRVLLAAVILSTLVAFLIPKQYESSVRIMPPEGQNPAAMLAALTGKLPAGLTELAGGLLGTKNTGPLYISLMQSRSVLDNQVDHFNLQKVYWKRYREGTRKKLASRTYISEDRKSGVITIIVSDTDPGRAKALAEGYVTELDQLLSKVSTSAARRERVFIEHRLEAAKADLEKAQVEFGQFASKNSTLDVKEQSRAMVSASAELQGRIIASESELQGLEQTYSENNVRIRSLRASIGELKRQQAKLGGSDVQAQQSELAAGEMYPSIRQLPILGIKWADLYRQAKIQETVFELLTQQYELAKIQEAREIPTVRVVDPADFPEKKAWPPRMLIILLGTLIGLVGFVGWQWLKMRTEASDEQGPWKQRLHQIRALLPRRSN